MPVSVRQAPIDTDDDFSAESNPYGYTTAEYQDGWVWDFEYGWLCIITEREISLMPDD